MATKSETSAGRTRQRRAGLMWQVTQGTSVGRVMAKDYEGAKARAAQIGFTAPDSIVLLSSDGSAKR